MIIKHNYSEESNAIDIAEERPFHTTNEKQEANKIMHHPIRNDTIKKGQEIDKKQIPNDNE